MPFVLSLAICAGILTGGASCCEGDTVIAHAATTDYSRYSNTMTSWFIKRATDHKTSTGAMSVQDLERYRAYYYDDKTNENVMYLTVNCDYENGYTAKILVVLKKHDVKAVFLRHEAFCEISVGSLYKNEGRGTFRFLLLLIDKMGLYGIN